MFLPLAMSTEASTMGIMLIDASAWGRQDTQSLLNFLPQATPALNAVTHTLIGLLRPFGDGVDQWQWGSVQLGEWQITQVCFLEHFPWPSRRAAMYAPLFCSGCVHSGGLTCIHAQYVDVCTHWWDILDNLHMIVYFLNSPSLLSVTKSLPWNLELNACITAWEANIWITGGCLFSPKFKIKIHLEGITMINN